MASLYKHIMGKLQSAMRYFHHWCKRLLPHLNGNGRHGSQSSIHTRKVVDLYHKLLSSVSAIKCDRAMIHRGITNWYHSVARRMARSVRTSRLVVTACVILVGLPVLNGKSPAEWRSRVVYQVCGFQG